MNLDNLARRVNQPALERCGACQKAKRGPKTDGQPFERDKNIPRWQGWHAFRCGLATNLHALSVDDKTIQAILRHSGMGFR